MQLRWSSYLKGNYKHNTFYYVHEYIYKVSFDEFYIQFLS